MVNGLVGCLSLLFTLVVVFSAFLLLVVAVVLTDIGKCGSGSEAYLLKFCAVYFFCLATYLSFLALRKKLVAG